MHFSMRSLAFATALCACTGAAAQDSPLLDVKTVSAGAAQTMVDACVAFANSNNVSIAVAVVDYAGNLVDLHRMDGASVIAVESAVLKAKTAVRWRRPTSVVNETVNSGRNRSPEWIGDFPQPGALPIMNGDQAAGAIGVGGGQNDEQCAQVGIDAAIK